MTLNRSSFIIAPRIRPETQPDSRRTDTGQIPDRRRTPTGQEVETRVPGLINRRLSRRLRDRVFPEVPVRQWVLSVPYALRYRLAYDSSLVRDVLQVFVRTIFASICRRAGIPASCRQARCGAVAFIQRFSDALNLDPPFHVLASDGIYVMDDKGVPVFRRVAPPTNKEVAHVAERIYRRVARLIEKRGLGPEADPDEADGLRRDEPLLAELYGAAISGRVATGPRAGMRITRVGDEVDPEHGALPSGPCCASVAGFSVHAGVCVPARDRLRLERLCRYAGRPPLSTELLSLLPDGRLLYRLKRRWRDGTTHVIYEPLKLMERLAALVHPPRFNITRYYGMFAPAASLRPRVISESEVSSPPPHPGCQTAVEAPATNQAKTKKKKRTCQPRNYPWATLMKGVFEVDVLACSRCGGRMRILAGIDSPDAIHKILICLGLPTRAPPIAPPVSDPETAYAW